MKAANLPDVLKSISAGPLEREPRGAPGTSSADGPRMMASGRIAGLLRRMASLSYDLLLLFAILFIATACALPFNGGEALQPRQWPYSLYLLAITAFFFGWFWTHGGQTLGMKAWGLRVCTREGHVLDWRRAGLRWLAACLSVGSGGLGYLWILVDPDRQAWHDRLSGTCVIHVGNDQTKQPRNRDRCSRTPGQTGQRQNERERSGKGGGE